VVSPAGVGRRLQVALQLARRPRKALELLHGKMMARRQSREVLFRLVDWRERFLTLGPAPPYLPPASLRFRVHGDLSAQSFLESGQQASEDIRAALAQAGREVDSFQRILDFGCGCGRTLIWLQRLARYSDLHGTDIDPEAIAWCRDYLRFGTFATNAPLPPLSYPAETFDLIYAISVFTHLDEDYQFEWLGELERVTQPGGVVLLTVHGAFYRNRMSAEQVEAIERTGFLFVRGPETMEGIFPEWYQTAFHTREYVLSTYSRYFDVAAYIPQGLDGSHDIVVLVKRQPATEVTG
jgi:SAM-dependent methyltransferase